MLLSTTRKLRRNLAGHGGANIGRLVPGINDKGGTHRTVLGHAIQRSLRPTVDTQFHYSVVVGGGCGFNLWI